ncbi:hypothetical protein ACFQ1M_01095 [Sungkyunkwania multivorans]|uniref:Uncharacterized protein n=1 Tax=Sungkyunkwania multivorans TaxID=1173618 RepID=A0ABW3CU99_9FLAO
MKKSFLIIGIGLLYFTSFSQGTRPAFGQAGDPQAQKAWEELRRKVYSKKEISVSNIKGSPFENDNFVPAVIVYEGKAEKEIFARFDAYNDEVEFKQFENENAEVYALHKSSKISCRFGAQELFYLPYKTDGGQSRIGYMYLQFKGNHYWFYARKKKIIMEKKKAYNSLQRSFPARFSEVEEFFIGKPNETLRSVSLRKKKIIEALDEADHQKAKDFVKEQKLNLKEPSQVIALLKYLDSYQDSP